MTEPDTPVLRVVRGRATDDEVAAVVTVVMARVAAEREAAAAARSGGAGRGTRGRSAWRDRSSVLRRPVTPGPGGWRKSSLPGR